MWPSLASARNSSARICSPLDAGFASDAAVDAAVAIATRREDLRLERVGPRRREVPAGGETRALPRESKRVAATAPVFAARAPLVQAIAIAGVEGATGVCATTGIVRDTAERDLGPDRPKRENP